MKASVLYHAFNNKFTSLQHQQQNLSSSTVISDNINVIRHIGFWSFSRCCLSASIKPIFSVIFFPYIKLGKAHQNGFALGHNRGWFSPAKQSPSFITSIKPKHSIDFLHQTIIFHYNAPLLLPRVQHGLYPWPEDPNLSEVWKCVTKVLRTNNVDVSSNLLCNAALTHVKDLQWNYRSDCPCSGCESPDPLYIVSAV